MGNLALRGRSVSRSPPGMNGPEGDATGSRVPRRYRRLIEVVVDEFFFAVSRTCVGTNCPSHEEPSTRWHRNDPHASSARQVYPDLALPDTDDASRRL